MNKLLYIGSGLDFEAILYFSQVKEFVFIDILPRSYSDSLIINGCLFQDLLYNHNFVHILEKKSKEYGFELVNKIQFNKEYYKEIIPDFKKIEYCDKNFLNKFPDFNPTLLVYKNIKTSQTLKYYISTNILTNMCDELKNDIFECTGLIISGYYPDKVILKYILKPITLYFFSNTCYFLNDDEVDDFNNVIYRTYKNFDNVSKYFNKLYVCDRKKIGKLIECDDIFKIDAITNECRNKN